jgi:hypothetical protein
MTDRFRERYKAGESLDDLLPEAFALAREAARRKLGERPYDVQVLGSIVLHQGKIVEMKTGEGKTLMSVAAAYLNAIPGEGVHVVTVNDYLASRDADWMRPVFSYLGITVGTILSDMDNDRRREAYACDVTYGTNNEFGFDYLRDNMRLDWPAGCSVPTTTASSTRSTPSSRRGPDSPSSSPATPRTYLQVRRGGQVARGLVEGPRRPTALVPRTRSGEEGRRLQAQ